MGGVGWDGGGMMDGSAKILFYMISNNNNEIFITPEPLSILIPELGTLYRKTKNII